MESVILEQKENLAMLYDQNPDPKQDENSSSGDSFSFLKETIKPKPVSREKIFMQLLRMAIYGVIIGMFACCSFFALKPWAEETFREDPQKVTIPEDAEDDATEADEQAAQEDAKTPVLDSASYQAMMESLSATAEKAGKGVVSVHAGSADGADDWMGTGSSDPGVAGIIAADNGQELLILADNSVCKDADTWEIVLADGSRCAAALKVQDQNRKLAVFSIVRSIVPEETWGKIQVADLGNSNIIGKGDPVIALGNLFGYDSGLGYSIGSRWQRHPFESGRSGHRNRTSGDRSEKRRGRNLGDSECTCDLGYEIDDGTAFERGESTLCGNLWCDCDRDRSTGAGASGGTVYHGGGC